ncbi:hypothetical protein [Novosphingobium sp. Leaf2]|uniref:hypothetical protein n=1 Tax=Novosphingobium sp. Leaf2 TaxID=1735670 RepID=UPI000AF8C90E|nr:hypothetical protein [Novosphingobium sp. Leaf2]
MFGTKINQVFKSRWHALAWSAGMLMTAYCSIPATDDADTDQSQTATTQHAPSPWDLNK